MKKLLFIVMILVVVFGWGASPAKAGPHQSLYLEKRCIGNQTCIITRADPPLGFLLDATIVYTDHALFTNEAGVMHEAATFLLTTTGGDTTEGHVSWVFVNGEFIGSVTILPGTGLLTGFHGSAKIDLISWQTFDFSFTGTYFFAP